MTGQTELLTRRAQLLGPSYRVFYDEPVHLVRGEGVWLWDADGKRYLDMYNNVPCVGHCHPHVVAALTAAAGTLNTHTRDLHEGVLDLAERLLGTMPAELGHVMFTCTGSEANDLAIRVAKAATGGTGIIVTANAYHGVTELIAGMSPSLGVGVPAGPGVYVVPAPVAGGKDVGERFADGVRAALAHMFEDEIKPAALLVDTLFSSDGMVCDPPGFLAPAVAAVRAAGGVFIADEVQPGFGRTGVMWGFSRHGLVPDLVTMGKPMGTGHPIAAMAARPVLEVIASEGLLENAATQGAYLLAGVRSLGSTRFGNTRGAGLYLGVDMIDANGAPDAAAAKRVVNGLRGRGVLIGAAGPHASSLKIRPPLPIDRAAADFFLSALADTLAELG